ncbi:hypothetical protein [Micropruina sp.]|uniref:hypothetical protein n=1 Tax=Micropruina sp. TaxID=2737536 RepID=UPI0039E4B258
MTELSFCGFAGCKVPTRQRMTLTSDGVAIVDRPICDRHLAYEFPLLAGTSLIVTKAKS